MTTRTLWTGASVPALGLGCWAIGGPFFAGDQPLGWGEIDDNVSIRAIHAAYDAGIRLFDTSDAYGTGHSETILGRALRGRPDAVIATKFGNTYDSASRMLTGVNLSREYIRWAVEASLARMGCEQIGLYQLHVDDPGDMAESVADTLEDLCAEGKIGAFGWSTDQRTQAARWVGRSEYVAVQYALNLFQPAVEMTDLCKAEGLLSLNRSPLAMGLLTAKFDGSIEVRGADVRAAPPAWLPYFANGRPRADFADRLDAVRDLLTIDGRSLAQGALGWIWARSDTTIPIPGFRTPKQVTENLGALSYGPLPPTVMAEIDALLSVKGPVSQ
ncbi:aldo/keto reductase [Paraburkholderia phosphatilytica]|uniref:aldo/keto reductase n=1 Tax=Paraburkholderia phosphatilytica TaxID=2282883 RepID=UPI000E4F60CD|nr:aldo/keto reductase [Paraburkholderia phosphatilytica]